MVEAQGFTVYMKLAIFTGDAPLGQVPGGDIQARGAQNRHLWEQGRGQVHPALVGEDAVGDVVDAQTVAALAPPCGKSTPGIGGGNGHKTQVVHAVFEGADFVVPNSHPVVFGGGLVGGQGNAVVLQGGQHIVQTRVHDGVGVHVDHAVTIVGQKLFQHKGFDGGGQLHNGVAKGPAAPVVDAQVGRAPNAVEHIQWDVFWTLVRQRQMDACLRVEFFDRLGQ